jgi:hypothetical protein
MDYASLQYKIPYDLVGKQLYITFRAMNYTMNQQEVLSECETVYIEIEFSEKERECQYNSIIQQ